MSSYALQIAYDGASFSGFQALPGQRTVQGELEAALGRLLNRACPVVAAGRTDAGVHAYGQIVGFAAALKWPPERLLSLLRGQLPEDIAALAIWPVGETFHARFSARARHYRYRLRLNAAPDPFAARFSWQYPHRVEPAELAAVWRDCLGRHDFAPFARSGGTRKDTRASVWVAEARPNGAELSLDIIADGFLYSMVRNLVGTALDEARGRLPRGRLRQLLGQGEPTSGPAGIGVTAPPQGLYLCRALYAPEHGIAPAYPELLPEALTAQIPPEALRDPGKWWQD